MIILGIDPGTATTGYGLLKSKNKGRAFELLEFGWIKTPKEMKKGKRLNLIYQEITTLCQNHQPEILSIERLFFATNVKTAMAVSEASGVIHLAATKKRVPVVEYTPMQIKKEVAGSGRADKKMMKKEVRKLLKIRSPNHKKTHFDDVCDALAVAICHARKSVLNL
jgi:crossover junction endodeoxyribonuclease RuvC